MKNLKAFYLIAFVAFGLFTASCGDDDGADANTITITIDEPLDGETITDCADVHIHIDIDASIENHEVEVELHPEGDTGDLIIEWDMHAHDMEVHFEQEVNLCDYAAGTCFHLEVLACEDHDCEATKFAEAEFCLAE